jgi:hypothetical protein
LARANLFHRALATVEPASTSLQEGDACKRVVVLLSAASFGVVRLRRWLSPRTRLKRPRKTTAPITAGSACWGSQVLPACSAASGTTVSIAIAELSVRSS